MDDDDGDNDDDDYDDDEEMDLSAPNLTEAVIACLREK